MDKTRDKMQAQNRHAIRMGVGALCCALAAPLAQAGPAEDNALAEKEFARGDLIASIALWKKAAEAGYAPAQARYGDLLDKSEEDEEAVEWYRKAAAQGNAHGEYGLGQMYGKGEGVPKDRAQALSHTLRAAQLNYVPAVTLMMEAYRAGGMGLAPNAAEADAWEAKLMALVPTYQKYTPKVKPAPKGKGAAKKDTP